MSRRDSAGLTHALATRGARRGPLKLLPLLARQAFRPAVPFFSVPLTATSGERSLVEERAELPRRVYTLRARGTQTPWRGIHLPWITSSAPTPAGA
jgi:hypothetical protein